MHIQRSELQSRSDLSRSRSVKVKGYDTDTIQIKSAGL